MQMHEHAQRYISKELTHFIGSDLPNDNEKQYKLLKKILSDKWLTHKPHTINEWGNQTINRKAKISQNEMYDSQVICFCDIPKDDLSIHVKKYGSFGLSFGKDFIIEKGGCPVLYIPKQSKVRTGTRKDISPEKRAIIWGKDGFDAISNHIDKTEYFEQMMRKYLDFFWPINPGLDNFQPKEKMEIFSFLNFHIFNHIVFFDSSLSDDDPNNYYFEREWRMNGHLKFSTKDIKTIFIPKEYVKRFLADFPELNQKLCPLPLEGSSR